MEQIWQGIQAGVGGHLPGIAGALAILFLAWPVAFAVQFILSKGMEALAVNQKLRGQGIGADGNVEYSIARGGFYLTLFFALLLAMNVLSLELAYRPFTTFVNSFFYYIPKIIGAVIMGGIAYLLASLTRQLILKIVPRSKVDQRTGRAKKPLSSLLADGAFYLVILLFIPAILGIFEMEGLLIPIQNIISETTAMLPKIFSAGLIFLVGWVVAKILKEIVSNLLDAAGVNRWGENAGMQEGRGTLSHLGGLVVYFLVLIPALIAALEVLKVSSITGPATAMLETIWSFIPKLLAAFAIMGITYIIIRPISQLVSSGLSSIGTDRLPSKMGLETSTPPQGGRFSLSKVLGQVFFAFILILAAMEATAVLELDLLSAMMASLIEFASQAFLGIVIISFGLWLANAIYKTLKKSEGRENRAMAPYIRGVILILVVAIGVQTMGVAGEIVHLGFSLALGALALAFALSFGLGGRAAAGQKMAHWLGVGGEPEPPKGQDQVDKEKGKEQFYG